jgi:prolyl-tRNA synthetase
MYLSQTNIKELREKVENEGGFQIAIAPMQPATFMNVQIATDNLYKKLVTAGFSVLVDDRGQKPKNMFEVIAFLGLRHRVVISSRSISKGVYEYKDLETDYFEKVIEAKMVGFLKSCVV